MSLDPFYWLLVGPVLIFSLVAQWMVKSKYKKYSKYGLHSGLSGAEIAQRILRANDIHDVQVEETGGWLSDHYSPTEKVLRLSPDVYGGRSVAAAGIAAHEAGHAIQHATGYIVMHAWQMLAKPATISSNMAFWIIMIGFFMGAMGMVKLGILLFSVIVLFQLITLPVEFDASRRAKRLLYEYGIIRGEEYNGMAAVLNSAAMTYVAAAASSVATLVYFLLQAGFLGGRDE
ncbi:MAG: zinc metallopeptidase [Candidatus Latescibacteria bacterium]|nr:zinc metallopeptidase [Candidatus Latescibacterota bacterium]